MAAAVSIHESFARFLESPDRTTLRDHLSRHVGELRNCDFKRAWPDHSALAKHVLALGNAGGGCLIAGVDEDADGILHPVGIGSFTDKAKIIAGVKPYLPQPLNDSIEIADFAYKESDYGSLAGKNFQVLWVHASSDLPFVSMREGKDIRPNAIYVRREGATEEASYADVQRLIKERLRTEPRSIEARSLKDHLQEIQVLYGELPKTVYTGKRKVGDLVESLMLFATDPKENPHFPDETYLAFVRRLLDRKKEIVERLVGL